MSELKRCPTCGVTIGGKCGGCSCNKSNDAGITVLVVAVIIAVLAYGAYDILLSDGTGTASDLFREALTYVATGVAFVLVIILIQRINAGTRWLLNTKPILWGRVWATKALFRFSPARVRRFLMWHYRHLNRNLASYYFLHSAMEDKDERVRNHAVYSFCHSIGPGEFTRHDERLVRILGSTNDQDHQRYAARGLYQYAKYSALLDPDWRFNIDMGSKTDDDTLVREFKWKLFPSKTKPKQDSPDKSGLLSDMKVLPGGVLLLTTSEKWFSSTSKQKEDCIAVCVALLNDPPRNSSTSLIRQIVLQDETGKVIFRRGG